jgi:hypothetical protein
MSCTGRRWASASGGVRVGRARAQRRERGSGLGQGLEGRSILDIGTGKAQHADALTQLVQRQPPARPVAVRRRAGPDAAECLGGGRLDAIDPHRGTVGPPCNGRVAMQAGELATQL